MTAKSFAMTAILLAASSPLFAGYYGKVQGGMDHTGHPTYYECTSNIGYSAGAAIGYEWCSGWRAEFESMYHHRGEQKYGSTIRTPYGWQSINGSVDLVANMVNVGSALPAIGCFHPYMMAGLGGVYARDRLSIRGWNVGGTAWEFGYQWIGGVEIPINECTMVGVQYRLLNTGRCRRQLHGVELAVRRMF